MSSHKNVWLYDESVMEKLTTHAWDDFINMRQVKLWLDNFKGDFLDEAYEKDYAGFLLTRFMFFGRKLTIEMMVCLYEMYVKKPLIQSIRKNNNNTKDIDFLNQSYDGCLKSTRFVSLGNPAESSAHLLYIFRQVNFLDTELFLDGRALGDDNVICDQEGNQKVKNIYFFDDIVGGGTQSVRLLKRVLKELEKWDGFEFNLVFLCLFASDSGVVKLKEKLSLNFPDVNMKISVLFELDDTYSFCQSLDIKNDEEDAVLNNSRFLKSKNIDYQKKYEIYHMVKSYGMKLTDENQAIGFSKCGFMIGFAHNTPNNTLPIFWYSDKKSLWTPIFNRFDKKYAVGRT